MRSFRLQINVGSIQKFHTFTLGPNVPFMSEDGHRGSTSLKLALGRLLPTRAVRDQIELTVQTIQILALRGSLVANTAVINSLEAGRGCPPVQDVTWWRNCISVCGYGIGVRGSVETDQLAELQTIALQIFGWETYKSPLQHDVTPNLEHPPVLTNDMASHISALVNEMQSACLNMVSSTFHKQLSKAFYREISIYCREENVTFPDSTIRAISRSCVARTTGNTIPIEMPDECPLALQQRLDVLVTSWSTTFADILPCPSPSFIENDIKMTKTRRFLEWLYALQEHRLACVQHMAQLLPPSLPPPGKSVMGYFYKKSSKPQALLPLCHADVRHIQINNSTMVNLINAIVARGDLPDIHKITSKTATLQHYITHFPGLRVFQKQNRYIDNGVFTFQSFRTDGVSASLLFGPKHVHSKRMTLAQCSEKQQAKKRRKTSSKTSVDCIPTLLDGKRIVSIDPGRTDMIYAVYGTEQLTEGRFSVPTANFRQRCHTAEAQALGEKCLKRVILDDGRNLLTAMSSLPSAKDVFQWRTFTDAYLPLLTIVALAKRSRCLRRTRFDSFIRRDMVLDQVIKEIVGGSLSRQACESTWVAFGAAKVCSTGFGHASSPQARLLHRLEKVHRVKVTMIDEFRTSQVCSCCNIARLYKTKVHGKRRWILESCPNCRNDAGTGPKILHHDLHGAMNIRKIFLEQMAGNGRPLCFTRGTERLSNLPRAFHPEIMH